MAHEIPTVNLKKPKRTKAEREAEMPGPMRDEEQYPFGTRLDFHEDVIEKMKVLQGIESGTQVVLYGKGKVIQVRTTDRDNSKKREHVEIQITDIGIADANDAAGAFKSESEKK